MVERTYMVALTQQELEAGLWCLNALSSAWLGSPNGTAIHGLKEKLRDARASGPPTPFDALTKAPDITG